jgi:hypothetical protein
MFCRCCHGQGRIFKEIFVAYLRGYLIFVAHFWQNILSSLTSKGEYLRGYISSKCLFCKCKGICCLQCFFLFLFEREGLGSRSYYSLAFSLLEYKSGSVILNVMLSMVFGLLLTVCLGGREASLLFRL